MKQLFVTILLIGFMSLPSFSQKKADVLARIGDMAILSEDFKNVYSRNNGNIIDPAEKKTPEEYLELYINFKLKVLEAQRLGLDTAQSCPETWTRHGPIVSRRTGRIPVRTGSSLPDGYQFHRKSGPGNL